MDVANHDIESMLHYAFGGNGCSSNCKRASAEIPDDVFVELAQVHLLSSAGNHLLYDTNSDTYKVLPLRLCNS